MEKNETSKKLGKIQSQGHWIQTEMRNARTYQSTRRRAASNKPCVPDHDNEEIKE